jgi:enoyl-CoA hydratase/carnithine racemase
VYKNILLEKEPGLAILIINRPQALNALNYETLQEIKEAILQVSADNDMNALIITGAGESSTRWKAGNLVPWVRRFLPALKIYGYP